MRIEVGAQVRERERGLHVQQTAKVWRRPESSHPWPGGYLNPLSYSRWLATTLALRFHSEVAVSSLKPASAPPTLVATRNTAAFNSESIDAPIGVCAAGCRTPSSRDCISRDSATRAIDALLSFDKPKWPTRLLAVVEEALEAEEEGSALRLVLLELGAPIESVAAANRSMSDGKWLLLLLLYRGDCIVDLWLCGCSSSLRTATAYITHSPGTLTYSSILYSRCHLRPTDQKV